MIDFHNVWQIVTCQIECLYCRSSVVAFMGLVMLEELRVIKFQINKNSEWIEIYKTFDDPNVIRSVYYTLMHQNNNFNIRILDEKKRCN